MAFDFPNSPTVGQIYNGYTWDGEKWIRQSTTGTVQKPDTAQYLTVSGTYYKPAGCTSIDVEWVGGGGGGAGSGTGAGAGGAGGATTFGPFSGAGGLGAPSAGGGSGGAASGGYMNTTGPRGGNASGLTNSIGGAGGAGPFGGSAPGGAAGAGAGIAGAPNTGAGGSGGGAASLVNGGGGGGAGGYGRGIINAPAASYAYTIGAGGAAGTLGTSSAPGGAGGSGCIVVTEHYDTVVGAASIDVTAKKNYIVNGAMQISQENGTTASTVSNYHAADAFKSAYSFGGVASFGLVASRTPGGSPNRLRMTVTTPDAAVATTDFVIIMQALEGLRVADLGFGTAAAKTITIAFGVKAPAGTYAVTLVNNASSRSYAAEYVISAGEANTDVRKSVTIPGDTTGTWLDAANMGIAVQWGLMCGSGAGYGIAPNVWTASGAVGSTTQFNFMGTNGNVFELFDVSLTEGASAPPFVVPEYANELALCQRYFLRFAGSTNFGIMQCYATTQGGGARIPLAVEMRGPPTIVASAASTFYANTPGGGSVTGTSVAWLGEPRALILGTSNFNTGLAAGGGAALVGMNASGFINISARL